MGASVVHMLSSLVLAFVQLEGGAGVGEGAGAVPLPVSCNQEARDGVSQDIDWNKYPR